VARTQELSGFGMEPLANGFELLMSHGAIQPEQLRSPTVPLALDSSALIEVVAMLQMLLCVASSARHRPNRQHKATLRLFEIAMQARWILWASALDRALPANQVALSSSDDSR
jgi:hypothetical protein